MNCMAYLFLLQRQNTWGPFLIISPASTLHNWQQECMRFVPRFKVGGGCVRREEIMRGGCERKESVGANIAVVCLMVLCECV